MGQTPLLDQYYRIKSEYPDTILFFRMGDFYEMFDDDAKIASGILGIALTSRDHGGETRTPLAGVPHHAAERYIAKLLEAGFKVAICEQVEDPKLAKGLVKREVVEVMTPGTSTIPITSDPAARNYLFSLFPDKDSFGLGAVEILSGEFWVKLVDKTQLQSELLIYDPKEILLPANSPEELFELLKGRKITIYEEWKFELDYAEKLVNEHLGTINIRRTLEITDNELRAAGAILSYLRELKKGNLVHLRRLTTAHAGEYMFLDPATIRNLELVETILDRTKKGSLYGTLDYTKTPMGSRLLRDWIVHPLVNPVDIRKRLDTVTEFIRNQKMLNEVREYLGNMGDIERLIGKIGCSKANPRELYELSISLSYVPNIKQALLNSSSLILKQLGENLDEAKDIAEEIRRWIRPDCPAQLDDGGVISDGVLEELDNLRKISTDTNAYLRELEEKLKNELGIPNLKIGYNRVFGYYIEVTKSYLQKIPPGFVRKQTLVGGERFINDELKELEYKILSAKERAIEIEKRCFIELRERIANESIRLKNIANSIAYLDVLANLAYVAIRNGWIKPTIRTDGIIKIVEGRHPVVEDIIGQSAFVPNDTFLSPESDQVLIITGPNMSGKSTYLRQVGLLVLLAHIGSYLPAKSAEICLVDRIFTRVGAWDNISRGESTFMLEMLETSNILNNATENSLVLLDEIGRGTSTYDGLSIAWAVAEYIHNVKRSKTIFATHYHELTELANYLPRVKNYQVTVRHHGGRILFLHKIVPGGCDDSYGIYVAFLAGIPEQTLERAKELLKAFESNGTSFGLNIKPKKKEEKYGIRLSLFEPTIHPIVEEIKKVNIETISPLDAFMLIKKWKEKWHI